MNFRAPRHTPALSVMLADLGRPHVAHVAALLGVHERTVYGWMSNDAAPRPAALALFWETRWGRNWQLTSLENEARMLGTTVAVLRSENERLKGRVAYLENVGTFGSANAPTFTPSPMWPASEGLRLVTSRG